MISRNMGPVKYKCLSIADKKKMIAAVEAGEKKRCCSTFWYISFYAFNNTKTKGPSYNINTLFITDQTKKCEYPDLEECLMAWFTQCRQNNIPISGPILKEKSKLSATNLGITNFQASEGWLDNGYNITILKINSINNIKVREQIVAHGFKILKKSIINRKNKRILFKLNTGYGFQIELLNFTSSMNYDIKLYKICLKSLIAKQVQLKSALEFRPIYSRVQVCYTRGTAIGYHEGAKEKERERYEVIGSKLGVGWHYYGISDPRVAVVSSV
ncbi:hypothetical protein QTP88_024320 [Uroleucon formosanum]